MNNQLQTEKIKHIHELFDQLILALKNQKFDFCAYVVEDAYRFFMASIEDFYRHKF